MRYHTLFYCILYTVYVSVCDELVGAEFVCDEFASDDSVCNVGVCKNKVKELCISIETFVGD